jgi:hypothetical protein
LALIIVIAGVFIVGLSAFNQATADQLLTVYARNPAPIPTDSAIITDPHDGDNVSKSSLPVSGTCPDMTPKGIVVLLDNGQDAGSAPCQDDNTFSLGTLLTPGPHTLIARIYTITEDAGPDSPPVTVTYAAPAPVTSSAAAAANAEPAHGPPLTVTVDDPFIIFSPERDAAWTGTITGGELPYRVHIDWGDGTTSDYTIARSGRQQFTHHYTSMHAHQIMLRVTDAGGRSIVREYAAVTSYIPPTIGNSTPTIPKLPFQGSLPLGLYGAYLFVIGLFGAIWIWLHSTFTYAPVFIHNHPGGRGTRHGKRHPVRTHRQRRSQNGHVHSIFFLPIFKRRRRKKDN